MPDKAAASPREPSPAALRRRRATLLKRLPPLEDVLRGSWLQRETRCGKPTCHCATGRGHPQRAVTVTLPGGRTHQVTVPAPLVRTVRRWLRNYGRWWAILEEISAINRRLLQRRAVDPGAQAPQRRRR